MICIIHDGKESLADLLWQIEYLEKSRFSKHGMPLEFPMIIDQESIKKLIRDNRLEIADLHGYIDLAKKPSGELAINNHPVYRSVEEYLKLTSERKSD